MPRGDLSDDLVHWIRGERDQALSKSFAKSWLSAACLEAMDTFVAVIGVFASQRHPKMRFIRSLEDIDLSESWFQSDGCIPKVDAGLSTSRIMNLTCYRNPTNGGM
jgi:hypothetical protein